MLWFTSDTHFGHANIIKYCSRPFSSSEEMDREMILRWNLLVGRTDIVFHLGDFSFKSKRNTLEYIDQLNGIIRLIPGNHGEKLDHQSKMMTIDPLITLDEKTIKEYTGVDIDAPVVLCHYAMRVWDKSHFNSYHLYGHSHGTLPGIGRSMDVGVDTNNFQPYSLETVIKLLSEKDNPNLFIDWVR